jgi:uncharacterized membrane protein YesL
MILFTNTGMIIFGAFCVYKAIATLRKKWNEADDTVQQ